MDISDLDRESELRLRLRGQAAELAGNSVRLFGETSRAGQVPAVETIRSLRLNLQGVLSFVQALEPDAPFSTIQGAKEECTRLLAALDGWQAGTAVSPEERALLRLLLNRLGVSDAWFEEALLAHSSGRPIEIAPPPRRSLQDVGLPVDRHTRHHYLLYSASARVLVAVLQPGALIGADRRVFTRQVDEACYREVLVDSPGASITEVVLAPVAPCAYLRVMRWTDGTRSGADFEAIFRLHLPDGSIERLPAPHFAERGRGLHRTWISQLLGAAVDDSTLHVVAGRPAHVGPIDEHMGYCLATYDIGTGLLSHVAELPSAFA